MGRLFWAQRGGGDFGIVTAVELELIRCPEVYGGRLSWPAEHAAEVLTAVAEVSAAATDELTLWAWLLDLPEVEAVAEPLRAAPARWRARPAGARAACGRSARRAVPAAHRRVVTGAPEPLCAAMDQVPAAMAPYNLGHDAEFVYPPDVLARLQRIKRRYDPDGVIRSNRPVLPDQTVAVACSSSTSVTAPLNCAW